MIVFDKGMYIDASTHSGKANLDPNLYSEDGMPIRKDEMASELDVDGLPLKPAKVTDDVMDSFKMRERYGAGILAKPLASGAVQAVTTATVPRATKFMFPVIRELGVSDAIEIVYTPECDEVIELLEEHLLKLAQTNDRADKIMMGKKQYRQYVAYRCYNDRETSLPKKVADADIIVLNQENYFDVLPDLDTMIRKNL